MTASVLLRPLLLLLLKINVFHTQYPVPSRHLLVQGQRLKRQNNVWNPLKVTNKDIRTTSLTSSGWFWCYLLLILNGSQYIVQVFPLLTLNK